MSTTTTTDPKATTTTDPKAPADPNAPAGGKQQAPVYTPEHPEYPKLLYNSKNRTAVAAKDKDDEGKLQGKGYSEDAYPIQPPDQMTSQDMQQLESLLHKLLAELSKQNAAAGSTGTSGTATDTQPPVPVPGAEPYPGATGAKDSSSSSTGSTGQGTASGASGKPPAKP